MSVPGAVPSVSHSRLDRVVGSVARKKSFPPAFTRSDGNEPFAPGMMSATSADPEPEPELDEDASWTTGGEPESNRIVSSDSSSGRYRDQARGKVLVLWRLAPDRGLSLF